MKKPIVITGLILSIPFTIVVVVAIFSAFCALIVPHADFTLMMGHPLPYIFTGIVVVMGAIATIIEYDTRY